MDVKEILIVDDSATSRMIIKRCIDIAGFHDITYHEAEDGVKAMSFLDNNHVDLVLTDLKMPKMERWIPRLPEMPLKEKQTKKS